MLYFSFFPYQIVEAHFEHNYRRQCGQAAEIIESLKNNTAERYLFLSIYIYVFISYCNKLATPAFFAQINIDNSRYNLMHIRNH